jgi:hypothetical protein
VHFLLQRCAAQQEVHAVVAQLMNFHFGISRRCTQKQPTSAHSSIA